MPSNLSHQQFSCTTCTSCSNALTAKKYRPRSGLCISNLSAIIPAMASLVMIYLSHLSRTALERRKTRRHLLSSTVSTVFLFFNTVLHSSIVTFCAHSDKTSRFCDKWRSFDGLCAGIRTEQLNNITWSSSKTKQTQKTDILTLHNTSFLTLFHSEGRYGWSRENAVESRAG